MTMVLLDTCALIWLASNQDTLSKAAITTIESRSDSLFVSAISAFELAIKSRNGKIVLPLPASEWYREVCAFHGVHELAVTGDIAAASVMLPQLHSDPCDRIIIATAQIHSMAIITRDALICKYPDVNVVW